MCRRELDGFLFVRDEHDDLVSQEEYEGLICREEEWV